MQYRESAADLVMEVSTSGSEAALRLFAQFGYAPAAPMVLEWLRSARATPLFACSLLRAADYRESIPVLRSLLPNLTWGNTDFAIIKLLADWGDAESVPLLLQGLEASEPLRSAAAAALAELTGRRLGPDAPGWLAWWREHRTEKRADWLFGALASPDREARLAAAEALQAGGAPPPSVWNADAPAAEREEAARAWRARWQENGLG